MRGLFLALKGRGPFRGLTEREFAWVLYDVGNSAFTMLSCSLVPIWFKALAVGEGPGQLSAGDATGVWALGVALVTVVVALLGRCAVPCPTAGGSKAIFFRTSVFLGGGMHSERVCPGWLLFLALFLLVKVSYSCSLTFYDSMLHDITTPARMDAVSAYGYAWGYLGSCLPFVVALVFYALGPDMAGLLSGPVSRVGGFAVTAVWWLLVTLPLLRHYRQVHYIQPQPHPVAAAFRQIGGTLKRIVQVDRKVFFFLLAFFLYIDGVGTIIDNCINIGTDLGLNTVGQVLVLLATQVVAWVFSLVFARLSQRHSTVRLLTVCIVGYLCVCLYALTLQNLVQFGLMAFGVGMFQGSIQSLSGLFLQNHPAGARRGIFFGLYDIFCKGASPSWGLG